MSDSALVFGSADSSERDTSPEAAALRIAEAAIAKVAANFPDWFLLFEDVQIETASRQELTELMSTAPTEFVHGLLHGVYLMRIEIAAITGRDWI